MTRLTNALGGRRPFPAAAATGKTGRAVRTLSRSNVKSPNWSIGRRRIYEWLGANCIAPDRLRVLSRDLLIRALAHRLQEQTRGGTSRAQRRRLQTLAREFEKGSGSSDPGIILRTGTTLVRQWRGHTHTVLVREDRFEYEGRHYRSLTVIAERITGAHWSGPRFFGLTKWASALINAEADRCAVSSSGIRAQGFAVRSIPEGARAGIQFAASAARSLRGVHQQPTARRLGVPARLL
jgi:hypothetical protein